ILFGLLLALALALLVGGAALCLCLSLVTEVKLAHGKQVTMVWDYLEVGFGIAMVLNHVPLNLGYLPLPPFGIAFPSRNFREQLLLLIREMGKELSVLLLLLLLNEMLELPDILGGH